ncbi:hypothetical protein D3C81_1395660 [compost metagenome]
MLIRRGGIDQPDFQIRNGRLVLSSGADAARDRIFTVLSINRGEWFLDVGKGIPYLGENGILGGKKTEGEVGAIIRREILLVDEVDRVAELSIDQDEFRHISVSGEVRLILANGTSETTTFEV